MKKKTKKTLFLAFYKYTNLPMEQVKTVQKQAPFISVSWYFLGNCVLYVSWEDEYAW